MDLVQDEFLPQPRVILILHGTDIDAHKAVTERLVQGGLGVKAIGLGDIDKADKEVALVVTAPQPLLESLLRKQEAIEGAVAAKMTEADGIRLLVEFVTTAKYFHGLGILVNEDLSAANSPIQQDQFKWVGGSKCVKDLIVLHDNQFEKKWMNKWRDNWILSTSDLTEIQQHMGEKVGFYFAFTNFYLQALVPLSAFGVVAYFLLAQYSYIYAWGLTFWGVLFVTGWKRQETWLADVWNSSLANKSDTDRPEFIPERLDFDSQTKEPLPYYPFWKRWIVHASYTLPMVLVFGSAVVLVSMVIVTTEILTAEVYQGPNKFLVQMLPSVIYVLSMSLLQLLYQKLSIFITKLENSQSIGDHEASLSRKSFIITCLLTQLSLLLTGVIYIPLSDLIVPYVNPFLEQYGIAEHVIGLNSTSSRNLLSPASLQGKVVSFSITNQIVNQVTSVLVPAILAWYGTRVLQNLENQELKSEKEKPTESHESVPLLPAGGQGKLNEDEELKFEIEKQLALPKYEMFDDYAELANQFSLVTMFSVSWPLVAFFCVANNFFDLRTHAFKICRTVRRPIPFRTNSIEPWTSIFSTFTVLGTVTTTILTLLYRHWDDKTPASMQSLPRLLAYFVIVVVVEHLQFFSGWIIGLAMDIVWGDLRAIAHKRKAYERKVVGFLQGKFGGVVEEYNEKAESLGDKLHHLFGLKKKKE